MDLSEAVARYLADRGGRGEVGRTSIVHLRSRLGGLVAALGPDQPVDQLTRDDIKAWQLHIGHHRPATRRAYLSTVRTFCRWCVEAELMTADPTAGLARVREPRAVPRALSDSQLKRLALVLPDRRAELVVALMVGCGLRCVEVARLGPADWDPGQATILVSGKGSDERTLPVPEPAAGYLRRTELPIGWSARRISRLVSRWCDTAGIKDHARDGISAHALRHSFASNALDRCGNVRVVQEALGHVSLATTQRYLRRANLDQLRAAMGA